MLIISPAMTILKRIRNALIMAAALAAVFILVFVLDILCKSGMHSVGSNLELFAISYGVLVSLFFILFLLVAFTKRPAEPCPDESASNSVVPGAAPSQSENNNSGRSTSSGSPLGLSEKQGPVVRYIASSFIIVLCSSLLWDCIHGIQTGVYYFSLKGRGTNISLVLHPYKFWSAIAIISVPALCFIYLSIAEIVYTRRRQKKQRDNVAG